jgi:hypothetical protein
MTIKTFRDVAAQGDCFLYRVDVVPAGAKPAAPQNGVYVVAHSETGHHHTVLERPSVRLFEDPADPLSAWLDVREPGHTLEHQRGFDTHKALALPVGVFKVRRQREYTPEGFRRAQD